MKNGWKEHLREAIFLYNEGIRPSLESRDCRDKSFWKRANDMICCVEHARNRMPGKGKYSGDLKFALDSVRTELFLFETAVDYITDSLAGNKPEYAWTWTILANQTSEKIICKLDSIERYESLEAYHVQ